MTKKITVYDEWKNLGKKLKQQGFDESYYDRKAGHYVISCSQCESLVINSVATHEHGCPNKRR